MVGYKFIRQFKSQVNTKMKTYHNCDIVHDGDYIYWESMAMNKITENCFHSNLYYQEK